MDKLTGHEKDWANFTEIGRKIKSTIWGKFTYFPDPDGVKLFKNTNIYVSSNFTAFHVWGLIKIFLQSINTSLGYFYICILRICVSVGQVT